MSIAAKIASLPRAARWGLGAVVLFGAYFGVAEPVLDEINRVNGQADVKAAVLASYESADGAMGAAAQTTGLGLRRFGQVEFPGDPESRPVAFNQAVDQVLKKHGISGQTSTSRVAPLGSGPLTANVGAEFRIDRLMKDIQFQAEPEAVAAVIADLERTPEVATVSRVQVRQVESRDQGGRQVRATIGVEAWLLTRKARG